MPLSLTSNTRVSEWLSHCCLKFKKQSLIKLRGEFRTYSHSPTSYPFRPSRSPLIPNQNPLSVCYYWLSFIGTYYIFTLMNYLLDNYYMDTILQLQQNYKRSTLVRYGFGALAAAALLRGVYLLAKEQFANRQIAFRKKQLARDVYVLQGDELVNFPWNSGNIGDWLYRRVQVSGRPLYYKECMVPNKSVELAGYEEVVPLVTRETEQKQEGIMLSKGFVPEKFKDPNSRVRIEDVTEQTFVGFVSRLDELSESGFGEGNVSIYRKHDFTHANLQDFADASQFSNKSQVAVALIEELDSTGPIDQRNPQRRAHGIQYSVQYPYKKTYSGALQLRTMPWEYRNESYIWFGLSALGLLRFLF